jgi:hypothetical protein
MLPNEIFYNIFTFLSLNEFKNVIVVSKIFYYLTRDVLREKIKMYSDNIDITLYTMKQLLNYKYVYKYNQQLTPLFNTTILRSLKWNKLLTLENIQNYVVIYFTYHDYHMTEVDRQYNNKLLIMRNRTGFIITSIKNKNKVSSKLGLYIVYYTLYHETQLTNIKKLVVINEHKFYALEDNNELYEYNNTENKKRILRHLNIYNFDVFSNNINDLYVYCNQ